MSVYTHDGGHGPLVVGDALHGVGGEGCDGNHGAVVVLGAKLGDGLAVEIPVAVGLYELGALGLGNLHDIGYEIRPEAGGLGAKDRGVEGESGAYTNLTEVGHPGGIGGSRRVGEHQFVGTGEVVGHRHLQHMVDGREVVVLVEGAHKVSDTL